MQTGRLILLLLLVLAVVVVVVLLLRSNRARKEQQRVEAALLRTDADQIAARLAGQTTFAQQAAERAEVARAEAEERAREAARLEEEAAEQRAAAEAARREYEDTVRRADDLDPDVREPSVSPVGESEEREADRTSEGLADTTTEEPSDAARATASDMTPATASGAVPAAAGAAAAGAALWGRGDGERHPESERIAAAVDYRDDEPAMGRDDDVSAGEPVGRAGGMSDDAYPDRDDLGTEREGEAPATSREGEAPATSLDSDVSHDVESPRGEWGGPRQDDAVDRGDDSVDRGDEGAPLTVIAEPEAYAATEPVLAADQTPPVQPEPLTDQERHGATVAGVDRGQDAGADAGADGGADADRGADAGADAGADEDRGADGGADADRGADAGADTGSGGVQIVADPDRYASTEPLRATEGAAHSDADAALAADRDVDGDRPLRADDRPWTTGDDASDRTELADPDAHAPAETGAAVADNDESTWTAADDAERATAPGGSTAAGAAPARDWAADESELLEQTHDRGDRLAEEREELARDSGTPTGEGAAAERAARRISDFHELRDGGYGVGSAAPLDDGAQPLDHPIQGHRDSMSFHVPGDPGYDTAEPDVWFYDEGAAERAGFRRSGR